MSDGIRTILQVTKCTGVPRQILFAKGLSEHRRPKRTMCGFGLQRSFGRNILELLVYYLMLNKRKNLKDMKSSCLSIFTSSL